jgi:CheY-like chemotaxis protein
MRRVVEAALRMAAHELRPRAHVVKQLKEVPPVIANEARLGQLFLDLLVNAARAIAEGDAETNSVTLATDVEDGHVVVVVTDTGGGIADADLPHVFDPFFTTHPRPEALGLGLSIAHGTVASLGGTMTAESVAGHGTRLRIALPIAPGYGSHELGSGTVASAPTQRMRLLVIDDDPLVARAVARSLSEEHDAELSGDARDALERIARGERYDVILCDLMMPDLTGMDFYREVVRIAPDLATRIVFMSGGIYTPRARAFVEAFPNRCIEKPPDAAKLREIVRRRPT